MYMYIFLLYSFKYNNYYYIILYNNHIIYTSSIAIDSRKGRRARGWGAGGGKGKG